MILMPVQVRRGRRAWIGRGAWTQMGTDGRMLEIPSPTMRPNGATRTVIDAVTIPMGPIRTCIQRIPCNARIRMEMATETIPPGRMGIGSHRIPANGRTATAMDSGTTRKGANLTSARMITARRISQRAEVVRTLTEMGTWTIWMPSLRIRSSGTTRMVMDSGTIRGSRVAMTAQL